MELALNNKNLKIVFLIFFYLIVFYFLIFKNILRLGEIQEIVEQENIKIGKLNYERNIVLEALNIKRKNFEKDRKKFEKQDKKNNKKKFDNIPDLFKYIEEKINKNNIIFQSFGRTRKDGDKLKISMVFSGSENNIKNFFRDIESENYDINFFSSYLKISTEDNLLKVRISLSATVFNKAGKSDGLIRNNSVSKDIFQMTNENPKNTRLIHSYMRIGNKKHYRVFKKKELENKTKTKNEEDKKNKKGEHK